MNTLHFLILFVIIRCPVGALRDFSTCHDDFSLKPPDGVLKKNTFGWLGFVQYTHVTTGLPHHSKSPRVTLIHKQYVIGTATDLLHLPKNYKLGNVIFGEYEREEEDCGMTKTQLKMGGRCPDAYLETPLLDITPHPEYSRFGVGNSLALVKLLRPIKSRYMMPICMPSIAERAKKKKKKYVFMVDYISNAPRDFNSERMGKKTLKLYTHKDCRRHRLKSRLGSEGVTHVLCSSGCGVRPGAPILSQNSEGSFELIGVAAGGAPCAKRAMRRRLIKEPPLYIDVYPYTTWIMNVITAHELPLPYPLNFRRAEGGTSMGIHKEFLRKRRTQKAGWRARTYVSGNFCFKSARKQRKGAFFYSEKFEVNANPPAKLTIKMKISAGLECTIVCARLLLPNRLIEPVIDGVGGYNISLTFSSEWFPYTFYYTLGLTGRNTTEKDFYTWLPERSAGFWLGNKGVSHVFCSTGCGVRPGAPIVSQNMKGPFELIDLNVLATDSSAQTQEINKKPKRKSYRMADEAAAECLFERLRLHQQRAPDSTEVARAITARINARLTSHDKHIRQGTLDKLWNKQSGAVQMLLSILENSRDSATSTYITSILREALCLKQGKGKKCSVAIEPAVKKKEIKKVGKENKAPQSGKENIASLIKKANNIARQQCSQHFISINGTQVVIRTLLATHSKRDGNVGTELMLHDLVWIVASLAPRDPKFAIKVRMLGCVRTMHLILKGHFTDNKLIFPLLVIMKQLAKNVVTTSILIRDGVIATYERVLVSLGFIPTARLRLCLDAIDYFSKNKVCCMQIVKTGLCSVLLRVFDRWDRYEGRMRLKICAHILQTLQHLCNIKAGRRALCTKKHVQTLHRFCSQCPDEPEFDGLLARVCSVITLCLKHQALPVPASSPAMFNLNPILKGTNTSWPCHEDEEEAGNSDSKTVNSDLDDDGADTDTEGIDEFPDVDFDERDSKNESNEEADKMHGKSGDSLQTSLWINPNERDIEDLKKYFIYFKEFGSYNKQVKLVKSRSNSRGSILEDFLVSQAGGGVRALSSPMNLSLTAVLGNTDYDSVMGTSQTASLNFGYHKIHESTSTTSCSSLKIHKDISKYSSFASVYSTISSRVRSVIAFVKVAYPDMMGGQGFNQPEPLNQMERTACRIKLLSCVDRAINPEAYMNEVVYDLDTLCCAAATSTEASSQKSFSTESLFLGNNDEQEITKINSFSSRLTFESRFESGNLRKAIQVGPREYELILMPDVNSSKRHQWFYFEVRNMQQGRPYIFNIVNCEKSDSQFNFGMKPVMYSVKEAALGKPGWIRAGSDICYYRNSYHYANQKNHNKCYLTVTFNIDFPHSNDVCYLAYHFPFTYSMMMTRIWQWSLQMPPGSYLRAEPLCYSLNNNEVPMLTVSAEDTPANPIVDREIVFLTARVHPGESNASWVMDGTLRCVLGDSIAAAALRAKYVFKIIPMLNVEGVINGCHRCGLTNEDLNRRWCKPSPVLHPSIYHTKGLIEYLVRVWKKPPLVYCDYHGHSRKKNVFFYGCAGAESWCSNDRLVQDEPVKYLMLPALMHRISPAFALGSCSFRVERERESTARVTVWRHLGVTRSYTMEASFCGFDRGPFKGFHLNTQHLQNVGSDFCEALNGLNDTTTTVDIQLTKDLNGEIAVDSEPGSGSDSVLKTDSDEDFD